MAILKRVAFFLLIIFYVAASTQTANAVDYSDSEIKAVFLYRLLYFIEWPADKNLQGRSINICVIGDNIFKDSKENLEKKYYDNKPIRLIEINNQSILTNGCRIIFISDSEKSDFSHMLETIKTKGILAVSDIPKFAKNNGMIGFTSFNSSIKLEINLKILSESNFKIDPNLLEAALHVY
jgi:hypothetical protein